MLTKESPLDGMKIGTVNTVMICELPELNTMDLRVAPGTPASAAVSKALGTDLPGKTGQTIMLSGLYANDAHVVCLAPDWWLLVGFPEAEQNLASLLQNDEHHFSLVDVSGQRTTIKIEGPNARNVLAHIWEQDLREKSFPIGSVSQGLMAKAPVIVYHAATFRYRVMVRSSFAVHLWKALVDAALEWM